MKIITSPTQLMIGQVVRVRDRNTLKVHKDSFGIANESELSYFQSLCQKPKGDLIEHVSFPNHVQLTWELAKERIGRWPFQIYPPDGSYDLFICGNKDVFYIRSSNEPISWWTSKLASELFITVPNPVIPDWVDPRDNWDDWVDVDVNNPPLKGTPCRVKDIGDKIWTYRTFSHRNPKYIDKFVIETCEPGTW